MKTANDFIDSNVLSVGYNDPAEIKTYLSETDCKYVYRSTFPTFKENTSLSDFVSSRMIIIIRNPKLEFVKPNKPIKFHPNFWIAFSAIVHNLPIIILRRQKKLFQIKVDWRTTVLDEFSDFYEDEKDIVWGHLIRYEQRELIIGKWKSDVDNQIWTSPIYLTASNDEYYDYLFGILDDLLSYQECGSTREIGDATRRASVDDTWDKVSRYFGNKSPSLIVDDTKKQAGHIYIIRADLPHGYSPYKIGYSRNIESRLKMFNVKLPFEFDIIHTIETEDMKQLERILHRKFAHKRTNGEWFDLTDGDIAWIKGYKVED